MDKWLIVYSKPNKIGNVIYEGSKTQCYNQFYKENPNCVLINMIKL